MDNKFYEKVVLNCFDISFVERGLFLFLLKTDKNIFKDCIKTGTGYEVTFTDGYDFVLVINVTDGDGLFKCEVEEVIGLENLFWVKDVNSITA